MITVMFILAITAFITVILAAMEKCPLWIPVFILALIALLGHIPMGR